MVISSTEFWGVEVPPGKGVKVKVEYSEYAMEYIHMQQAAFGEKRGSGRTVIFVTVEGEKFALGTLEKGRSEMFQLELIMDTTFRLSHTGSSPIYITGYKTQALDEDVLLNESSDEEDDGGMITGGPSYESPDEYDTSDSDIDSLEGDDDDSGDEGRDRDDDGSDSDEDDGFVEFDDDVELDDIEGAEGMFVELDSENDDSSSEDEDIIAAEMQPRKRAKGTPKAVKGTPKKSPKSSAKKTPGSKGKRSR